MGKLNERTKRTETGQKQGKRKEKFKVLSSGMEEDQDGTKEEVRLEWINRNRTTAHIPWLSNAVKHGQRTDNSRDEEASLHPIHPRAVEESLSDDCGAN